MDKVSEEEDYMLYAVLNGGAPYLVRDGAYQNTDGSFAGGVEISIEDQIKRCKVVSDLHEKLRNVRWCAMRCRWKSRSTENNIC